MISDITELEDINFIHIPKNGGTSVKDICYKNLKYNGHNTDVYNSNLRNQLIIIRHPIERFVSAVYYAIEKWSHSPKIKYLISNGINTPEKWVQIWSDPNHTEYDNVMSEMLNKGQKIGKYLPTYKFTYSPQSLWINQPKYVILMENLFEESEYFMKRINNDKRLPYKNKTSTVTSDLSEKSIEYLTEFYKEDFILYEKYKIMSLEDRMPFT